MFPRRRRRKLDDPKERKHRRTHKHPASIAFMAGANFDRVPSLAEAMGLTADEARAVTSPTQLSECVCGDHAGYTCPVHRR